MNRYLEFSKSAYYAVIGSLPLLIAYEVLILLGGSGRFEVRNAADVMLRDLLGLFGLSADQAYLAMILLVILSIPLVKQSRVWIVPRYFAYMLGEALGYSLVLGFAINLLLQPLFFTVAWAGDAARLGWPLALPGQTGTSQVIAQSLGAGLFEEFLFRVLILNGLLLLTRLVLAEWLAVTVAIAGAAFVFALAHYVGPLGDPLDIHTFLFRWMAGLLFTVLYHSRGFAVTAYAHALYDIRVLLF